MKNVLLTVASGVLVFVLGYFMFDLHSKQQRLGSVDINHMIHQAAEGLAKQSLKEEQLPIRLAHFKKDLEKSLGEFAHKQRVILISSHMAYGDITDMTEQFIAHHNGETK